jgi:hypothetical protein
VSFGRVAALKILDPHNPSSSPHDAALGKEAKPHTTKAIGSSLLFRYLLAAPFVAAPGEALVEDALRFITANYNQASWQNNTVPSRPDITSL